MVEPIRKCGGADTNASYVDNAGNIFLIEIANPEGLASDEHPYARELLQALHDAGVQIRAAVL